MYILEEAVSLFTDVKSRLCNGGELSDASGIPSSGILAGGGLEAGVFLKGL